MDLTTDRCKQTYIRIWEIENVLRQFIYHQLSTDNPGSWLNSLPQDPRDSIVRYLENRRRDPFAHPTLYQHLCFIDFPHLAQIIENRGLWDKHFRGTFINQIRFINSLRRIEPVRNAVAHNRSVTETELQLVSVFHSELQSIFGAQKYRELLDKAFAPINIPEAIAKMILCIGEIMESNSPNELRELRDELNQLMHSAELNLITLVNDLAGVDKLLEQSSHLVTLPPAIPIYLWKREIHQSRLQQYAEVAIESLKLTQKEWRIHE